MIAERLAHQQRHEIAEQRAGDARKQPGEADDAQVRYGVASWRGVSETASIIRCTGWES